MFWIINFFSYVNLSIFLFFSLFPQNTLCPDGWPLSIYGSVALHLGTLDEAVIRDRDLYLCVKPIENEQQTNQKRVELCVAWRSAKTNEIIYRILDPEKDTITPISLEMLTEELPQLLQTLLVSVEQSINRVPLDDLSFVCFGEDDDDIVRKRSSFIPTESPKCGIKRREIITKNKSIHGRYALRRMSQTKNESDSANSTNGENNTSSTAASNALPLFCFGGSFPHIDSDEDSTDDAAKAQSQRE